MRKQSQVQDDGIVSALILSPGWVTYPRKEAEAIKRRKAARDAKWRAVRHLRERLGPDEIEAEERRLAEQVKAILAARETENQTEYRKAA